MSSILKALKKLEAEKTALNEEKRRNLSGDILKPQAEKRIKAKWLWLLAGVSSTVILLLIVALLNRPRPELISAQPVISSKAALTPIAPSLEPVDAKPADSPRKSQAPLLPAASPPPAKLTPAQAPPAQSRLPSTARPELPGVKAPEPAKTEAAAAKPQTGTTEPALTLNGIAWNRDSADRLAIINGQPSRVGEIVAGAVVVEILQDRARLTRNGRNFELTIGKSSAKD